jgi:hypothetical protein
VSMKGCLLGLWHGITDAGAGLQGGEERLFGGCDPTPTHCAAHNFNAFIVAQHTKRIGGGAGVGMLRVGGGQGLAAKSGDVGDATGQGGQSEASAGCRAELRVGEGEAAGGWECLKHAEAQGLATLRSRACAIYPSAVLPSKPRSRWS